MNVEVIGITRIQKAATRWRTAYKKPGVSGLEDSQNIVQDVLLNED